jgi:integrase
LLALRWTDLDPVAKKLRIERALEQTKKFGIRVKPPKTKRGFRTIDLDDSTVNILLIERGKYQRLMAGIPDGAAVDLSLVRLPSKALMFPDVPERGSDVDLEKPRNPRNFSKEVRASRGRNRHGRNPISRPARRPCDGASGCRHTRPSRGRENRG